MTTTFGRFAVGLVALAGCSRAPEVDAGQEEVAAATSAGLSVVADLALANDEGGTLFETGGRVRAPDALPGPWTTATPMPLSYYSASVAHRGYVFIAGGGSDKVFAAPLSSAGVLGAWTEGATIPGGINFTSIAAYDGYVWVIGGTGAGGPDARVWVGRVGASGVLEEWRVLGATPLPSGRYASCVAAADGLLIVTGGAASGTQIPPVEVAAIHADGSLGPWLARRSMTTARMGHGCGVWNRRLYVIGGATPGGVVATIDSAELASDGTVGEWRRERDLSGGTNEVFGTFFARGRLFVAGGARPYTSFASAAQSLINPVDGTLGEWAPTPSLPQPSSRTSGATDGHTLVLLGGHDWATSVAWTNTVYTARLDPDRAPTLEPWTRVGALPAQRSTAASFSWNGVLYQVGGSNVQDLYRTSIFTRPAADGTISAWTPGPSYDTPARNHTMAVAVDGFAYLAGGNTNTGDPYPEDFTTSDVQFAAIESSGALGAWTRTTRMISARRFHATVAHGGFIYVAGGSQRETFTLPTWFGRTRVGGGVESWEVTAAIPEGLYEPSAVVHANRLYLLGGDLGADRPTDRVRMADILPTGALSAFRSGTPLPRAYARGQAFVWRGRLYLLSGYPATNEVSSASIRSDGSFGAWAVEPSFPNPRSHPNAWLEGDRFYLAGGGIHGALSPPDVWSTIPRRIEDTGRTSFVTALDEHATGLGTITIRSTGDVRLAYQVAPASGVFGPVVEVGVVADGVSTPAAAPGAKWVRIHLALVEDASVSDV